MTELPDRQDLVRLVGGAMQQYQRSTQAFDDAVGRRLRLNPADLRCLDWLVDGPRSAGQLSAATGLTPAATTAMIDRLTRKGFVQRASSDGDRRRVMVEMTAAGAERTWALYGPMVEEGKAIMAELDTDELVLLRELLDRIRELTDRHRDRLSRSGTPPVDPST